MKVVQFITKFTGDIVNCDYTRIGLDLSRLKSLNRKL